MLTRIYTAICSKLNTAICHNPADTLRNNDVVITSKRRHFDAVTSKWRRFDVITTLLLLHVFDGKLVVYHVPVPHLHTSAMFYPSERLTGYAGKSRAVRRQLEMNTYREGLRRDFRKRSVGFITAGSTYDPNLHCNTCQQTRGASGLGLIESAHHLIWNFCMMGAEWKKGRLNCAW